MQPESIVFLSSPSDSAILLRLFSMLRPYERTGTLSLWDESRLLPGERREEAFRDALRRSAAVVLLVSPDLGASDLMARSRLPWVMAAVERREVRLLSLFVRPSGAPLVYHDLASSEPRTFALESLVGLNNPQRPLSRLKGADQEAELARIAAHLCLPPGPTEPCTWQRLLGAMLDDQPAVDLYDRSSRRPARVLAKLDALFDLKRQLSAMEHDSLIAAAYVDTLLPQPPDLRWRDLLPPALTPHVAQVVNAGAGAASTDPVRHDLLIALLRIGGALDLDQAALRHPIVAATPQEQWGWLVLLTQEIRVRRGGVVTILLSCPDSSWERPLRRALAMGIEALWQELRGVLTRHGLALALAPCETGEPAAPPQDPGLLPWLIARGDAAAAAVARLRVEHLGDAAPPVELAPLLPLPGTAVLEEMTLCCEPDWDFTLTFEHETHGQMQISLPAAEVQTRTVDLRGLLPGTWRWQVEVDYGTGTPEVTAVGEIHVLPLQVRDLARHAHPDHVSRLALALGIGHQDAVLTEVWPQLSRTEPDLEALLIAHRLVSDAYRWMLTRHPNSRQLERYGETAAWLGNRLSLNARRSTTDTHE